MHRLVGMCQPFLLDLSGLGVEQSDFQQSWGVHGDPQLNIPVVQRHPDKLNQQHDLLLPNGLSGQQQRPVQLWPRDVIHDTPLRDSLLQLPVAGATNTVIDLVRGDFAIVVLVSPDIVPQRRTDSTSRYAL